MKILYAGIRHEGYNPARRDSFEYINFFLNLKYMLIPGQDQSPEVIEHPFDRILEVGKKKWNEELLEIIKKENPTLLFVFMYTDELDPDILLEIKNNTSTKTIAWFADDYWRFWNYSKHWPPYFTYIVTTYSKTVEWYKKAGYENVILSQWGYNDTMYKPPSMEVVKDIDVSFVGQYKSGRKKVINALRRAGINVQCFGFGWPNGKISHEEMLKIFWRSKICLNLTDRKSIWDLSVIARLFFRRSINRIVPDFHFFDNLRAYCHFPIIHTHARPFELAGCRAFAISGRSEDIGEYFTENKEMVFYDDIVDLIKKIKYYLVRDTDREKIAQEGYLKYYTYNKRFLEIFKKIGLNL